jgi:tetratricopeptide (TPR) repeat protein
MQFQGRKKVLMRKLLSIFVVSLALPYLSLVPSQAHAQELQQAAHQPQARSQQEHDDFVAAYAIKGAAAAEKAAEDFSAKYPGSELRRYLYTNTMHAYQSENNPAKMLAMGEKVLTLDPDDVQALVLTATALADNLAESDRDREKKIDTIRKNANRAIQRLKTGAGSLAPGAFQQAVYRTTLQAMAYSALAIMKLKTGDDTGAENDLKTAADLEKTRPDPYIWYHLALAQDHRRKYIAALTSVEQALQLSSSNPELQRLAEAEHERLIALTGRTPRPAGERESGPPQ